MARYITQYKMHTNCNKGKVTPYFIEDGGYFPVEGRKFIGVTFDEKQVFLPDTVVTYTNEQFIAFIVSLEINKLDQETMEQTLMTDEEKTQVAIQWLTEKGF
jgi:hypothetical protein